MNKSWLLYNESIFAFKNLYYGHLLRQEHLAQKGQTHIPKFRLPATEEAVFVDFWGYHLIKDGVNYLIESTDENRDEIKILDLLPVDAQDLQKVADTSGEVYFKVCKPVPRRIRPEKAYSPKEFIDNLTLLKHSNPKHQKLLAMMAMSQLWDRAYYRVATPPGTGKDSIVDLCNSFFGGCRTVESPTIAKLEYEASVLKWLVANEIVDIPKEAYDVIQNFMLPAAAHKNEITKHSREFKGVNEIINASQFSLSLFYNDIIEYPTSKKYFDNVTKGAVKDRFPAFRLYGEFQEDFNSMKHTDVKKFVEENMDFYVNMVRTFLYFKENYTKHLHKYNTDKLNKMSGRDATNLGRLIKIVDFYCESQYEFDAWLDVLNSSMEDYIVMLDIPRYWEPLIKKLTGGNEKDKEEEYSQRQVDEYKKRLRKIPTSQQKIEQIKKWLKGEDNIKPVQDKAVWDNFDKIDEELV